MRWKKSLLVMHKILRLFVQTLTADDKHYLLNRHNLAQRIQMQLSQKQKSFARFFLAFLRSILNFEHFPTLIAHLFPEVPAPKNMVS